jgi:glycosyltransferase involved in cell wall biosynthesis
MKILQLSKYYPPTHGGIELVAEFFSRASKELGHDVSVIALGMETKKYIGKFGEIVYQCSEDIKLRSSPLSLSFYSKLKDLLEFDTPNVIYVHLPNPFAHEVIKWFANDLAAKKVKVIGIFHSDIINQNLLRDSYNLHFSRHMDLYDSFISASSNLKESSAILSRLPSSSVRIIPFCVDHKFLGRPIKRPDKFQGKFITIGRMVPYKGYEFLIKSFNELPYDLTIIGNGPLFHHLKNIAGPNIHFTGEISEEEKFELLNSHDALIVSSINRAEAYGMTIVEAFSVGLPVIASDIDTGVSFLVRDGETGFKFPIFSKEGLIQQIEKLKNNPQLGRTLSETCFSFFQKELNFLAFKKHLNNLYNEFSN